MAHHGRPVRSEPARALDKLIHTGSLHLSSPDPNGRHPVCLTVASQIRYAGLRKVFRRG